MTIYEMLQTAQFVVDEKGQRTAVFLPLEAWENLLAWMQQQDSRSDAVRPVDSLAELWGEFWPKDEEVDGFIDTVRQWRQDDLVLHQDLT